MAGGGGEWRGGAAAGFDGRWPRSGSGRWRIFATGAGCEIMASMLLAAVAVAACCLDEGFAQMYNLDFPAAHRIFGEWIKAHPDDPVGPAADAAAYLFAEFDRLRILQSEFFLQDDNFRTVRRLSADPAVQKSFETQLAKADELAKVAISKNPADTNAMFAGVLLLGLRADYQGLIEKRYLASLATTRAGRAAAERLLAVDAQYHDAWLAIGVENYLFSLKPLPLRWLLQLAGNATDRDVGLEKLRITAEKGRYFKPFAELLLAVAALRANDEGRAKAILKSLRDRFPHNHLYAEELARLDKQ